MHYVLWEIPQTYHTLGIVWSLPHMGNLMTPVQFWGFLSFSKTNKLPARASILKKANNNNNNNNNNHYIQGSSLVCSTTEAQGFRFNSRGKALRPCCRIACITLRGRDVASLGKKEKVFVLSCGYTFGYTTYVLLHGIVVYYIYLLDFYSLGFVWVEHEEYFARVSHAMKWRLLTNKRWPDIRIHQVEKLEKTMKKSDLTFHEIPVIQ